MVFRCSNQPQAFELQKQLRDLHKGTDWVVSIIRPYYDGDDWRVVVS